MMKTNNSNFNNYNLNYNSNNSNNNNNTNFNNNNNNYNQNYNYNNSNFPNDNFEYTTNMEVIRDRNKIAPKLNSNVFNKNDPVNHFDLEEDLEQDTSQWNDRSNRNLYLTKEYNNNGNIGTRSPYKQYNPYNQTGLISNQHPYQTHIIHTDYSNLADQNSKIDPGHLKITSQQRGII